jgi:hypothetical protein
MKLKIFLVWTGIGLSISGFSFADDVIPVCPAYGRALDINNQQVLHWKRTTPNQFRDRAHVRGPIVRVFPEKNGHEHFEIKLGKREIDTLEVIYNQDFGLNPEPKVGMMVQACGDYITSKAQSGPYPPSPSGAIIHWVHMNPAGRGHDPGFMVMDGIICGQDASNAGPDPYPNHRRNRRRPVNNFSGVSDYMDWVY